MHSDRPPLYVTQPDLPELDELLPSLRAIWASRQLTNGGVYHQRLEAALGDVLGSRHVSLVTNATIGLMIALREAAPGAEVITTPFTFSATAQSLIWNRMVPVFADIDPVTLNIDPASVEAAVTPRTRAIFAVHCYGHPCDVQGLQRVADAHGLRVVYDAAHAFGVQSGGQGIGAFGDLSVFSFHATKVFNTFEGGAIVCRDAATKERIDRMKNFGIGEDDSIEGPGLNGKMSEFNAALGLVQLERVDHAIRRRGAIDAAYRAQLAAVPGIRCLEWPAGSRANYAYFPILVGTPGIPGWHESQVLFDRLRGRSIFARRYFHPLVSHVDPFSRQPSAAPGNLPVAEDVAGRVLCLPLYPAMTDDDVSRVVDAIIGR
jgi:dTDP-4-amino-4,6-dideoxygalactose transaminase